MHLLILLFIFTKNATTRQYWDCNIPRPSVQCIESAPHAVWLGMLADGLQRVMASEISADNKQFSFSNYVEGYESLIIIKWL